MGKARQRIRHRPQSMRPSACRENAGSPPEGANEMSSTFMPSASTVAADRRWHIIDAEGRVLGRIATLTARLLQGKHKARYTPFLDLGDHVVVVNAAKVKLTGAKRIRRFTVNTAGMKAGCGKNVPASSGNANPSGWSRMPCAACSPKRSSAKRCTAS